MVKSKIVQLLNEAVEARDSNQDLPFIDESVSILEEMAKIADGEVSDSDKMNKLIGGLGYLVLENRKFTESDLGQKLLFLIDDVAKVIRK